MSSAMPGLPGKRAKNQDAGGRRADAMFGAAPPGYVPGKGRGATGFTGGVSRDEVDREDDKADLGDNNFDEFTGYGGSLFADGEYDEEDKEADLVYEVVETRMDQRRKVYREELLRKEIQAMRDEKPTIQAQFAALKRDLAAVSREEWEGIPEAQEHLKVKPKKRESNSRTPDHIIAEQQMMQAHGRSIAAGGATPMGGMATPMAGGGMATPMGFRTPMGMGGGMATPVGLGGMATPLGLQTPTGVGGQRLHELGEARGTVLAVKLDKVVDSVQGQTVVDPKGYLTDLKGMQVSSDADISDINKARTLYKSVMQSNPKYATGWIAAARLEEVAGKIQAARALVSQGCKHCPKNEDIWLEAARLEKPATAKAILAKAIKAIPLSVRLWLDAANREKDTDIRKKVIRKALEFIPNSVRLWKEAVTLEKKETDAMVMLSRAVECVPHSTDMWLALAKLSDYQDARKVLNEARKHIPTEPLIWVTAAKLEETQGNEKMVDLILTRAIESLAANGVTPDRDAWLKQAEDAERTGFIVVCQTIVKVTIDIGVETRDPKEMKQIWGGDADGALARGSVETARAIYNAALTKLWKKKGLWLRLAELETKFGDAESLDKVLSRATKFCPHAEILWLMSAKQKWIQGDVEGARLVLGNAFKHSPDSEAIHLAAVRLESENKEIQRARQLLAKARQRCNTPKVWMQSVQLEREQANANQAMALVKEALEEHPNFGKLWMIGGQIHMEKSPPELKEAVAFWLEGVKLCPKSVPLWLCVVDGEMALEHFTKARSLLEKGRLQNPGNDLLWLRSIEVEIADGNQKAALMKCATALQEAPQSGVLWAKAIELEPKQGQSSKSVDALKKCENDAVVVVAVATLFWFDNKISKARKWFNRAVSLNPSLGDAWGAQLAFELEHGSPWEQREVIRRFVDAEPNQGLKWNAVAKKVTNWRKSWPEKLHEYLKTHFSQVLTDKVDSNIMALLNGEEEDTLAEPIKNEAEIKVEAADPKLFSASSTFDGARPGWYFSTGKWGTGYYADEGKSKKIKKEIKRERDEEMDEEQPKGSKRAREE